MNKKNNTILSNRKPADFKLKQLQKDFNTWRKSRSNQREAIPEHLWDKTIKLLKYYNFAQLSSRLHLNYKKLKTKAKGTKLNTKNTPKDKTDFIEVNMSENSGTKNCLIELENTSGEYFKIHGNHKTVLEHIDFIKSFLAKK